MGGRSGILLDALARAPPLTLLALGGWSGGLPLLEVLLLGALASFFAPASYAGARWLVGRVAEPQRLPRMNAFLSVGDLIPTALGGALVGPILTLIGPGPALLVPVAMLLGVVLLATGLPGPQVLPARSTPPETPTERGCRPRGASGVAALIGLSFGYYIAFGPFDRDSLPHPGPAGSGTGGVWGSLDVVRAGGTRDPAAGTFTWSRPAGPGERARRDDLGR